MLNANSRMAIRISNLPDWGIDWSDTTPQRSRDSLTVMDFMLSETDAAEIHERVVCYMMGFMVFLPEERPVHPVVKTEVASMKVYFSGMRNIFRNSI